jgi:hypothetical protein
MFNAVSRDVGEDGRDVQATASNRLLITSEWPGHEDKDCDT